MTTNTDIVNRALQTFGTRTTVSDAELLNNSSNEAIQANLILTNSRDDLTRMAPWDCAMNTANLAYITSTPGTPQNMSPSTQLWTKGQPPPPWAYEYQYPEDCLRACYVIPASQTGFSGGVPITTAVTGGASAFWSGPPVRYKVAVDQFYPVLSAGVQSVGAGYAVGDLITLQGGSINGAAPIGAGVVLRVLTLTGSGIATVAVVNQIAGSTAPLGGSYFLPQSGPQPQASSTGSGTGATFNLTFGSQGDQRVVLTNQEFATLSYCKRVVDPNVMDTLFQSAWISILGAGLCMALTGDKALANLRVQDANNDILMARNADANEGLTINDVTPDWIRIRGSSPVGDNTGPYAGYDWGSTWPMY